MRPGPRCSGGEAGVCWGGGDPAARSGLSLHGSVRPAASCASSPATLLESANHSCVHTAVLLVGLVVGSGGANRSWATRWREVWCHVWDT